MMLLMACPTTVMATLMHAVGALYGHGNNVSGALMHANSVQPTGHDTTTQQHLILMHTMVVVH